MQIGSRILVVCIGNICRSPAAEAFFSTYFKAQGIAVEVESAGIHAMVGDSAAPNTQKIMSQDYNIAVSQHRARQLTENMIFSNQIIITMEKNHTDILKKQYSFASGKIYRLGEWRHIDIADPYQQPEPVFKSCIDLIHACTHDWIKKFW